VITCRNVFRIVIMICVSVGIFGALEFCLDVLLRSF